MGTLRYRYRLYPTAEQQSMLSRTFGCVRVVWNDALARDKRQGQKYDGFAAASRRLTAAKKTEERQWLAEVPAVPLQQALRNLDRAYRRFFDGLKGKGPRCGAPAWKKRLGRQAAEFTRSGFTLKRGKLRLAKIGLVPVRWSRALPSEPKTATVTLDPAGRYHVSFTVEKTDEQLTGGEPVGVDLGIADFAALSTGDLVSAPDYSKLEKRIAKAQRVLARKRKGSRRRDRAKRHVAKLREGRRHPRRLPPQALDAPRARAFHNRPRRPERQRHG